jgi:hypothetical protein
MHPIFRNKGWFAVYLIAYAVLGLMMTALFQMQDGALGWEETLAITEPLCIFFAFICLSPWYICRQLPIVSTGKSKLALYHMSAAIASTALWIAFALAIGNILDLDSRINYLIAPLIAVGFLLYLLSVALHYMHPACRCPAQHSWDGRAGHRGMA